MSGDQSDALKNLIRALVCKVSVVFQCEWVPAFQSLRWSGTRLKRRAGSRRKLTGSTHLDQLGMNLKWWVVDGGGCANIKECLIDIVLFWLP